MKMPRRALALALVPMFAAGCTQVQAKQAFKDGMKPLRVSGAMKVAQGVTTAEEVLKVAPVM